MIRLPALGPVTARLRRVGHLPAVLLADLPTRLTGAPKALTGRRVADDLDAAFSASLARLVDPPGVVDDHGERRIDRPAASGGRPRRAARPSAPSAQAGRAGVDLPGRAAGRETTVHGVVGGPSRPVHHDAGSVRLAGVVGPRPAGRPARSAHIPSGWGTDVGAGGITPAAAPTAPRAFPGAGPVVVHRDAALAALLGALAGPAASATPAVAASGPPAGSRRPARATHPADQVDHVAAAAVASATTGASTGRSVAVAQPSSTSIPPRAPRWPLAAEPGRVEVHPIGGSGIAAPSGLVELVSWWESAAAPDAGGGPAERAIGPASMSAGVHADADATVGADPLSMFRDALEMVLLDEALGDGLEVG